MTYQGWALYKSGNGQGIDAMKQAVDKGPRYSTALVNLATAYTQTGKKTEATQAWGRSPSRSQQCGREREPGEPLLW